VIRGGSAAAHAATDPQRTAPCRDHLRDRSWRCGKRRGGRCRKADRRYLHKLEHLSFPRKKSGAQHALVGQSGSSPNIGTVVFGSAAGSPFCICFILVKPIVRKWLTEFGISGLANFARTHQESSE
jgi:hypothetical protein